MYYTVQYCGFWGKSRRNVNIDITNIIPPPPPHTMSNSHAYRYILPQEVSKRKFTPCTTGGTILDLIHKGGRLIK